MADLERYLRYLQRDDVAELVLQTGKVAALRLAAGKLHPLTKSPLVAGHIVALLDGANLRSLLPSQDTAGQVEAVDIAGVGYEVRIARRKDQLQLRFSAGGSGSAAKPARSPAGSAARARSPSGPAAKARGAASAPAASPRPSTGPATERDIDVEPGPSGLELDAGAPASPPARSAPASRPRAAAREGAVNFATRPPRCTWNQGSAEARMLALLTEARESGCTDVHLIGGQPARLRRLGELTPVGEALPEPGVRQMLMPLLEQAGEGARAQLEELGYADFAIEFASAGRMRVNFARGRSGLKGCFRLIVSHPPSLDELDLPVELRKVGQYHQGLAVVSGPSGQGKTTTMAALVDLVNRSKPHHIITVEDPIEVVHPIATAVISQRQVGLHTASFHRALKAALREDPDVIVIGELRDRETVEMALQAAETGHLVIASMSTPNGAKTIDRLIDMFPPDDQAQVRSTLAGALKVVVSQRLVPTADRTRMVAASELITGNIPLWSLIRENKLFQLSSLLQRGRNYGMIRAEDSLNELLAAGTIDLETARHYADDPRAIGTKGSASSSAPATASGGPTSSPTGGPPSADLGKAAIGAVRSMFGRNKSKGDG